MLLRSIIIGISRAITNTIFVVIGILYLTQPNVYRALTPSIFGIEQVAPKIFTDQPAKTDEIKRAITASKSYVSSFFPTQTADPTYIVCFTSQCEQVFGNLPLGLTLGYHRIIISSRGFDRRIFNHERVHVDLHSLLNLGDTFTPRYPMWFNEGLAEFLSGSNCQGVRPNFQEIQRIQRAETMRDWNVIVSDRQFRRHYGAACRAVEQISQKIGKSRLSELVHNTTSRQHFIESLP
jgi:hypothetical protein